MQAMQRMYCPNLMDFLYETTEFFLFNLTLISRVQLSKISSIAFRKISW